MITAPRLFLANGIQRRFFMNGAWLPLSLRLVVELDFSAFQLLLMGTAIESAILLGEVPTGVVADVFSRKWSVVLGAFFLSLAQFLSGLVADWELFLVTQFIWGIGWTFISGAEVAWVTDEVGSAEDVEPLLIRRGRLELASIMLGAVVFGGLALLAPLTTVILIAGSCGLIWTVILAIVMPETGFQRTEDNRWREFLDTAAIGARVTRRVSGLRLLAIALVLGGMAAEAVDRLDVRRLEDLGLSTDASPVLVFGGVLMFKSALGALLLWRFENRFSGRGVTTGFASLLFIVAGFVLALAHVPLLAFAAVALVIQGGLLDITSPLISTWTNALAPANARATVHSFIGQARALGEIFGGVFLGVIAASTSLSTTWTVAAGLFIFAGLIARSAHKDWPALT